MFNKLIDNIFEFFYNLFCKESVSYPEFRIVQETYRNRTVYSVQQHWHGRQYLRVSEFEHLVLAEDFIEDFKVNRLIKKEVIKEYK